MKKILIALTLLLLPSLEAAPFKQIFSKGRIGDYSIYQSGDSVTLLNIHSKDHPYIVLEEITFPKALYENVKGSDLVTWVKKGAPGNTSWTLMEINTKDLSVSSAYSFSRKTHLFLEKEDTLISSLLNLDVTPIPERLLDRVGPRQMGKKDTRPLWEPAMYVAGKRVKPKKMDVYGGTWEKDNSALSGRSIDLYILNDFPFPYWIQIKGDFGSKKMISLDSGKHMVSPIESIPAMPPKFLSGLEKWKDNPTKYSFLVQSARVHRAFTTYLLELGTKENGLKHIESQYQTIDNNVLKFNLHQASLEKELTKGKKYRLYLSYEDEGEIKSLVSREIIHWK